MTTIDISTAPFGTVVGGHSFLDPELRLMVIAQEPGYDDIACVVLASRDAEDVGVVAYYMGTEWELVDA